MPAVSQVLTGSRTVVAGDGLTIDITIPSVDVSRSIVMHTVRAVDAQSRLQRHTFAAHLVNATTLRLQRYESAYAESAWVEWTVVEFESGALANLQTGLVTPTSNTTDTAITPVDTGAALPIVTRYVDGMSPGILSQTNLPSFEQTSVPGDTLRLKWNETNYTPGSGYRFQIIEFDPADAAVQSGTIVGAWSSYSGTATISAVDLGATLLAFFGTCGGDAQRGYTLFKLNSATQVYAGRQELGSAVAFTVGWFAVEMLDGSVVEAGALSIADGSTTPASQPSWTPALTAGAVFHPNSMPNARIVAASDVGGPKDVQHTVTLDAGQASATVQRYGSVAQVDLYWQVVDWKTSGGATPYPYTAAGGATAGGAAAHARTKAATAAGGAAAGGAAAHARTKAATAAGGATAGGAAAHARTKAATAAGTVTAAGAAQTALAPAGVTVGDYTAAGTITAAGAAAHARTKAAPAAGGAVVSGLSPVAWGKAQTGSGGALTGGGAGFARVRVAALPVGGATAAGAAATALVVGGVVRGVWVGVGGTQTFGAAAALKSKAYFPAGAVAVEGVAPVARGVVVRALGGAVAAGAAPVARGRSWFSGGGVTADGAASTAKLLSVAAVGVGGAVLVGVAPRAKVKVPLAAGGALAGGVAVATFAAAMRAAPAGGGYTRGRAAERRPHRTAEQRPGWRGERRPGDGGG